MRRIAQCKNHNPVSSIYGYIDRGFSAEVYNARIVTLSTIFMELLPLLNFCNKKLVRKISLEVYMELNETRYTDRGPSEKVQNARIITLSTVFTELLPYLIFAIKSLSGAYL